MTLAKLLEETGGQILRRDAETLLLHVAGRDRAWLLAHPEAELPPSDAARFRELVSRRQTNEPVQYLTGRQEFFGLDLRVTPDVLIPRPETELLVEAVVAWVRGRFATADRHGQPVSLVDVGTGSGAIALASADALPELQVWAVDVSEAALAVARGNAERLRLIERVRFRQSDLLGVFASAPPGPGGFDVVVSNPPYVPVADSPTLQPEVRDFEPHLALFAGQDGLAVYRRLIPQAWLALRSGGLLAMEFGFGQRQELACLLQGWDQVNFLDDYAGIPRVVLAERP